MSDGVLKISSVHREDEGEYVCVAKNSEGSSSGRLNILVRGNHSIIWMLFSNTTINGDISVVFLFLIC